MKNEKLKRMERWDLEGLALLDSDEERFAKLARGSKMLSEFYSFPQSSNLKRRADPDFFNLNQEVLDVLQRADEESRYSSAHVEAIVLSHRDPVIARYVYHELSDEVIGKEVKRKRKEYLSMANIAPIFGAFDQAKKIYEKLIPVFMETREKTLRKYCRTMAKDVLNKENYLVR